MIYAGAAGVAGNFDIMLFGHYLRCNISIRHFAENVISLLI